MRTSRGLDRGRSGRGWPSGVWSRTSPTSSGRFDEEAEAPYLAIEVVWISGGIDKLAVYAGLGVREVWFWKDGRLSFHALREDGYHPIARSELLPGLEPELIGRLMDAESTQTQTMRELRAILRAGKGEAP